MHRDNPYARNKHAVTADLKRGSGGLPPPPCLGKAPPPPKHLNMATTLDYSRPIQTPPAPTPVWWKRLCQSYVTWANTTNSCAPCGRVPDEWLDYEIDQEMRRQVMEEICQPADEYGDDVGLIIEDVRGSGGFGAESFETSDDSADEAEPSMIPAAGEEPGVEQTIMIGEVECPVNVIRIGEVECPIHAMPAPVGDGGYHGPSTADEREDEREEPPGDGEGLSRRRSRLRVHAKFIARMAMVLRARHGRLSCEPANQLLVSNDYSRILRRPEYNMRAADIEAHRRDVLNTYFADLPFEKAPLVRSRLPVWFKDLMDVPAPALRPLVC